MLQLFFVCSCVGTTEKIFQSKKHLYDVFVDNQNITTHLTSLDPVIRLTPADKQRFEHLNGIRYAHLRASFPSSHAGRSIGMG